VPFSNVIVAVVAAFIITQFAIFTTTVYLHRALSHRALTVRGSAAIPFRMIIWMTTGMRPREWVAVHRKHHAATDTPDDPHSPMQVGFWRVQLGNVGLYKRVAADEANTHKYARDIAPDLLDKLALDYSLLGLGIGTTILVVTLWALGFGLLTGLLAAGLHAVFYVMLSGAINAVGHTKGTQPYENSATNLQTLADWAGATGVTEGLLASLVLTLWVLWTSWAVKLEQPSDPADPRTATPVGA